MYKIILCSLCCSLLAGNLLAEASNKQNAPAQPEAKPNNAATTPLKDSDNVPFSSFQQYFVRGDCPWDEIHQEDVFGDLEKFNKYFGYAHIRGNLPKVSADTFKQHFIAAMARKSDSMWHYKVHKVSYKDKKLSIYYSATQEKIGGGSATFMCPLILSLPKEYSDAEVKFVSVEEAPKAAEAAGEAKKDAKKDPKPLLLKPAAKQQ